MAGQTPDRRRQARRIRIGDDPPVGVGLVVNDLTASHQQAVQSHLVELPGTHVSPQQIALAVAGVIATGDDPRYNLLVEVKLLWRAAPGARRAGRYHRPNDPLRG